MLNKSLTLASLSFLSLTANAALYDRGNGLIYDDSRNVTWMQDASYAVTQHQQSGGLLGDEDGYMTWHEASSWVDNLNYGNYSGWRLAAGSEWGAYEFNSLRQSLGNSSVGDFGNCSGGGDPCFLNNSFVDPVSGETISLINFRDGGEDGHSGTGMYWHGTSWSQNSSYDVDHAWAYRMGFGNAWHFDKGISALAWAVADGDIVNQSLVSFVPIPSAVWLFGSALLGLAGLKRKK
ncbi:VPLPA-CTERM sorting domain-containing protein [Oceanicoccus sp. KOV_DT_Chl]|uniref:VPLPA-CTERM sorting domain-containing protein n=1 Tax=Oceanicoccus sp. KOV_DT_Chl TaxID=1904639 RepID=UPI00135BBB96|nr:VPLPA-CTERM sorting domain-containing protein [Oceanicoccus sp. KOV_DT_Chl]